MARKASGLQLQNCAYPREEQWPSRCPVKNASKRWRQKPKLTPLISPDTFLNIFEAGGPGTVEHKIVEAQEQHRAMMEQWEKTLPIQSDEELGRMTWKDKEWQLVIPPDGDLKRRILREYHDHWGTGHPGRDETIRRV
jgi:hypothetical protein